MLTANRLCALVAAWIVLTCNASFWGLFFRVHGSAATHWLFAASLFVALLGWNVGLNAGGLPTALLGLAITMIGIMIPSTTLTYLAARWGHENRELRAVRAFKQGMAPIVIALLVATGWILATGSSYAVRDWPIWAVAIATAIVVWRTKVHLLWLLGAGALLGWMGWV